MNVTKHIVTGANWDEGRGGKTVTGIVLHTMVGYMQGSENRFNDPSSQVSVHYGVGLDGSIRQWVEEPNTAYQAGNYPINQTTIGIEHEDANNPNDPARTEALYDSSSDLVADICKRYGFTADPSHIFLHKNVIDKSVYPGGTACPDGLDTSKIMAMAAIKLNGGSIVDKITIVGKPQYLVGSDLKRIDIFARGSDDGLWQKYFDAKGWHDWTRIGGGIFADPTVVKSGDRYDIFTTGIAGDVMHFWLGDKWNLESLGIPKGTV